MDGVEEKLLYYINQEFDINYITKKLKVSNEELISILYDLKKQQKMIFYRDGSAFNGKIYLKQFDGVKKPSNKIILSEDNKTYKFLIVADTHYGSKYENLKAIDTTYNYATHKQFNIVLHLGDLLNGVFPPNACIYTDIEEEFEHFLKHYPYDKTIVTYMLFGNHDNDPKYANYFKLYKKLSENRVDFICCKQINEFIEKGDDQITLAHERKNLFEENSNEVKLGFCGHSHVFKVEMNGNSVIFTTPSLSNLNEDRRSGFLTAKVKTDETGITDVYVNQKVLVKNKVINAGEFKYEFQH